MFACTASWIERPTEATDDHALRDCEASRAEPICRDVECTSPHALRSTQCESAEIWVGSPLG